MKTINIKNVVIGEGIPKICVPLVGNNAKQLIEECKEIQKSSGELVEWRMDCFAEIEDYGKAIEMAKTIRTILKEFPLIATFRTSKEGGNKELSLKAYVELYKAIINSGVIDIVDIEYSISKKERQELLLYAHARNVKVLMSNHNFYKTPSFDTIIKRLKTMQELGADIVKCAYMPTCKADVKILLQVGITMMDASDTSPCVLIAMGESGLITRVCGELFGSAITFGSIKNNSAPGQMNVENLRNILNLLHEDVNKNNPIKK